MLYLLHVNSCLAIIVLPFGLSSSEYIFIKTIIVKYSRSKGEKVVKIQAKTTVISRELSYEVGQLDGLFL